MTPTYSDLFRVFGRIGMLSFGGPAAQIALMHKELVEERPWMSEEKFLGALSFCMLLPGPEAMQLATYAGWRLRGTAGGLLAGLLFVLPGAAVILALAASYVTYGGVPLVQAAFLGVKSAVVVVVLQALWKLSRKALITPLSWALAAAAFVAIYALGLPFPLIVALAALIGFALAPHPPEGAAAVAPPATKRATVPTFAIWSALWALPVALVFWLDHSFLQDIALFFSKLAIVTFGGAYAVLAYMTQTVSVDYGWISTAQMIDALGLAETTPGPLILVTEFVGLLAGYQQGGVLLMLLAGALTLWCTFVPCFLWIFVAAPYVEWLTAQPRLKAGLAGITAAVVGVILNLSLWFALHVLFADVARSALGAVPVWHSFDPFALLLVAVAAGLLLWRKLSLPLVLLIMAALSTGAAMM
ncbi:chromate efflux transporter [Cognatishimia sp. SS12]|uniref:chromate efflux transporter n=1 Tax=Cognatishimia sp. SS12 TaxID=2979465 RepID=UPI002330EC53|nr:chromate efflux transporter [Cognatishimia sp. SS12]MDC0737232.1 chromate efflux transporter [Cognatishimia sp. SS12]